MTYRRVITGVSTLIKLVNLLCRLVTKFGTKIDTWVGVHVPEANRATLRAWIAQIQEVCLILGASTDD